MEDLSINGSVVSGAGQFSGSIISDWDIHSVTIGGDVFGSASNPVHIEGVPGK